MKSILEKFFREDCFTVFKFDVALEPDDLSGGFGVAYEALEHNLFAFARRNPGSGCMVHYFDATWWNCEERDKKIYKTKVYVLLHFSKHEKKNAHRFRASKPVYLSLNIFSLKKK